MLLKILAAFHLDSPDSLKRAIATAIGGLAVLLINPFLVARGLPPVNDVAIEAFAGLLVVYVIQSGAKAALVARAETAVTPSQPVAPGAPPKSFRGMP